MQELRWDDSPDALTGWQSKEVEAARAKARKRYADALKPICSRCGKPGADCRKRESCDARRLKKALKGCDSVRLEAIALPRPPIEWKRARGYSVRDDWRNGSENVGMRQHYAYDVAMGVTWEERKARLSYVSLGCGLPNETRAI